jgi:tight adherence protein C
MEILLAVALFIGIFMFFYGSYILLQNRKGMGTRLTDMATHLITEREKELAQITGAKNQEELLLEDSFSNRLLRPLGQRIGKAMGQRTHDARRKNISEKLIVAGRPYGLSIEGFLASKAVLGILVLIASYGFYLIIQIKPFDLPVFIGAPLAALVSGTLGYVFPDLWLRQQVSNRRELVSKQLPDTLDLLSVCADAGLGFDASLMHLVDSGEMTGPLIDEIGAIMREVRLGRPRGEALQALADRIQIEEFGSFISALLQSEKLGVPISQVLRRQGEDIRRKAKERAEIKAGQAPLKMLFPMIGCIFPTIFIMLMGPAVLLALKTMTP